MCVCAHVCAYMQALLPQTSCTCEVNMGEWMGRRRSAYCKLTSASSVLVHLQLKMGLLIDLTNTKRFYNSKLVEAQDCRYIKLQCKG